VIPVATLEMVPLRSKYPNNGRVTLRYAMPPIDPSFELDAALRESLERADTTTTPKVVERPVVPAADTARDDETPARKGGQAR